jgi:hypothetical protein
MMANEQQQLKPTSSTPDPLTGIDLETDPILKLGEVKVSRLQASIIVSPPYLTNSLSGRPTTVPSRTARSSTPFVPA